MAIPGGLEPPTSRLEGGCSVQLSYGTAPVPLPRIGRKGKRGKVPYAVRFHLGPGVEVALAETGRSAGLALPDGSYWQFAAGAGGTLELDESIWVDGEGRPHPVHQLVMQGLVSRGGGSFAWLLKKMS